VLCPVYVIDAAFGPAHEAAAALQKRSRFCSSTDLELPTVTGDHGADIFSFSILLKSPRLVAVPPHPSAAVIRPVAIYALRAPLLLLVSIAQSSIWV
jgi:hypothetical protein